VFVEKKKCIGNKRVTYRNEIAQLFCPCFSLPPRGILHWYYQDGHL